MLIVEKGLSAGEIYNLDIPESGATVLDFALATWNDGAEDNLLQSAHGINSETGELTYTYSYPGATYLLVTFSERTDTSLVINGQHYYSYNLDGEEKNIDVTATGGTMTIVVNSTNTYDRDYGFAIRSKARKYRYQKKDAEENVKFPNEVNGNWDANGPIQIVISDMTIFKNKGQNWEWTLLVDTFNNEILAHQATPVAGSNKPYYHCLEVLKKLAGKKNEEQTPQVVLHTDQGSVYSSQAFRQAHEHYNILRSMSKVGTPTDNAIIEALNGWIKEELYLDFGLETAEDVPKLLDEYVYYFNNRRPAAALGYKSPVQYKTELGF